MNRAVVPIAVALIGCADLGVRDPREVVNAPVGGRAALDVLLVVDNSGDMERYQARLAAHIHRLTDALELGAPVADVRSSVVTTDRGTLDVPIGDPFCSTSDEGQLQTSGCAGIADDYLVDR